MSYSPGVASVLPSVIANYHPAEVSGIKGLSGNTFSFSSANDATYKPISIPFTIVVTKILAFVNSSGAGNYDLGIYTDTLQRIVSLGSTAAPSSGLIEADITDTLLYPGEYYLAVSSSSTATAWETWSSTDSSEERMCGYVLLNTSHPLPSDASAAQFITGRRPYLALKTF